MDESHAFLNQTGCSKHKHVISKQSIISLCSNSNYRTKTESIVLFTKVQAGDVDMAIGGDQGGSIRIPSSICGIVGLKPTWGLVPYTGAVSIETTIDHLGPMARTVEDCALLLEVSTLYGRCINTNYILWLEQLKTVLFYSMLVPFTDAVSIKTTIDYLGPR